MASSSAAGPSRNTLTLANFDVGQLIGVGTFSQVHIVRNRLNAIEQHAMKIISLEKFGPQWLDAKDELMNMRQLNDVGIVEAVFSMTHEAHICIFMPLAVFNSCKTIIKNQYATGMPQNAVALIMRDVLRAVKYLHQSNYVHCSIKASHILIMNGGLAKLTGFRFMQKIPQGCDRLFSTGMLEHMHMHLNWLSPEFLEQEVKGFNCKADIYSVGITILEMANGFVPFGNLPPHAMLISKLREEAPRLWDSHHLPSDVSGHEVTHDFAFPGNEAEPNYRDLSPAERRIAFDDLYRVRTYTYDFIAFVTLCLIKDPVERPDFQQLAGYTFMKNVASIPSSGLVTMLTLDKLKFEVLRDPHTILPWLQTRDFAPEMEIEWEC